MGATITDMDIGLKMKISRIKYLEDRYLENISCIINVGYLHDAIYLSI